MRPTIRLTDEPDPVVHDAIVHGLAEYNQRLTGISDRRLLVLSLDDSRGRPVGGLWGRTVYSWLFVELLFVPERLRGQGLGTDLLRRAEDEARARGCHSAWLDTFAFQARGFYERLGYRCFAELGDYPKGISRYFMRKALAGGRDGGPVA